MRRPASIPAPMYPVDFPVEAKGTLAPYRALAISEDVVELVGRAAMPTEWVATLTLRSATPSMILATVRTCRPCDDGYLIAARPFALSACDRDAWRRIVDLARTHARTVLAS